MTTSTNGAFDRTPLIAGNWKMNMDHVQGITLLQKLAWTLSDAKHDYSRVEVAVFPPFTDLRGVQTLVQGDELNIAYGGQDLSQFDSGAYTGDISGQFLNKLGCKLRPRGAQRTPDHPRRVGRSPQRQGQGGLPPQRHPRPLRRGRPGDPPGRHARRAHAGPAPRRRRRPHRRASGRARRRLRACLGHRDRRGCGPGRRTGNVRRDPCRARQLFGADVAARPVCCTAVRSRPTTLPPSWTKAMSTACWWAVPAWIPLSLLILSGSRATS